MKPTILKRHDPRRNDVIGLVRRQVSSGRFTKADVDRWKKELEADVVDAIIDEVTPKKKAAKAAASKKDKADAPKTE